MGILSIVRGVDPERNFFLDTRSGVGYCEYIV